MIPVRYGRRMIPRLSGVAFLMTQQNGGLRRAAHILCTGQTRIEEQHPPERDAGRCDRVVGGRRDRTRPDVVGQECPVAELAMGDGASGAARWRDRRAGCQRGGGAAEEEGDRYRARG